MSHVTLSLKRLSSTNTDLEPVWPTEVGQTLQSCTGLIDHVGVTIVAMGNRAGTAANTDENIEKCRIIADTPRTHRVRDLSSEIMSILWSSPRGQSTTLFGKSESSHELQNSLIFTSRNGARASFSRRIVSIDGIPALNLEPKLRSFDVES